MKSAAPTFRLLSTVSSSALPVIMMMGIGELRRGLTATHHFHAIEIRHSKSIKMRSGVACNKQLSASAPLAANFVFRIVHWGLLDRAMNRLKIMIRVVMRPSRTVK